MAFEARLRNVLMAHIAMTCAMHLLAYIPVSSLLSLKNFLALSLSHSLSLSALEEWTSRVPVDRTISKLELVLDRRVSAAFPLSLFPYHYTTNISCILVICGTLWQDVDGASIARSSNVFFLTADAVDLIIVGTRKVPFFPSRLRHLAWVAFGHCEVESRPFFHYGGFGGNLIGIYVSCN